MVEPTHPFKITGKFKIAFNKPLYLAGAGRNNINMHVMVVNFDITVSAILKANTVSDTECCPK